MGNVRLLITRLDEMQVKERALLLLAATLVIYFVFDSAFLSSISDDKRQIYNRVDQLRAEVTAMTNESEEIKRRHRVDPDAANRDRQSRLTAMLDAANRQLAKTTDQLIPPGRMAKVLENVLVKSSELDFVGLVGLGAETVVDPAAPTQNDAQTLRGAYRHGIRIEFAGSYLDAVEYLKQLEELPWTFFWDAVDIEVTDYPNAFGSIVVYTLSLDASWIGV